MNAGEPGGGKHSTDGFEAAPTHFGRDLRRHFLSGFCGALVKHPVQFACVGLPAQPAASGVFGFVVIARQFQRDGVQIVDVTSPMGTHDRELVRHGVQVVFVQKPVLLSFGIVELESLNPLTPAGGINSLSQGTLDFCNRALVAVRRHDVPSSTAQNVNVGVDETRNYRLASHVLNVGARSNEALDVGIAADTDKLAVLHRQSLSVWCVRIDRDYVGALEHCVCLETAHNHVMLPKFEWAMNLRVCYQRRNT